MEIFKKVIGNFIVSNLFALLGVIGLSLQKNQFVLNTTQPNQLIIYIFFVTTITIILSFDRFTPLGKIGNQLTQMSNLELKKRGKHLHKEYKSKLIISSLICLMGVLIAAYYYLNNQKSLGKGILTLFSIPSVIISYSYLNKLTRQKK